MAEACHLTRAPSCAQHCQWLLIHILRRQLVYARPGALDTQTSLVTGFKKRCHTALRVSLVAQLGEGIRAYCGYQGHGISGPIVGACEAPLWLRWRIHDEWRCAEGCCGKHLWHARPSAEDRVDRAEVVGSSCCEGVTIMLQIRCIVSWVRTAFGTTSRDSSKAVSDVLDIAIARDVEALQGGSHKCCITWAWAEHGTQGGPAWRRGNKFYSRG